jgi:hypothetical protein
VRFDIFMALTMKNVMFRDVTSYSLIDVYLRFGLNPEHGRRTFLRNVNKLLDHMPSYLKISALSVNKLTFHLVFLISSTVLCATIY